MGRRIITEPARGQTVHWFSPELMHCAETAELQRPNKLISIKQKESSEEQVGWWMLRVRSPFLVHADEDAPPESEGKMVWSLKYDVTLGKTLCQMSRINEAALQLLLSKRSISEPGYSQSTWLLHSSLLATHGTSLWSMCQMTKLRVEKYWK